MNRETLEYVVEKTRELIRRLPVPRRQKTRPRAGLTL